MLVKIIGDLPQNPQAVAVVIRIFNPADRRRVRFHRFGQLGLRHSSALSKRTNLPPQRQLLPRSLQLRYPLRPASVKTVKKNLRRPNCLGFFLGLHNYSSFRIAALKLLAHTYAALDRPEIAL